MQQFVVPQFIDVEDKIFGPITTRQFLILLVAGLITFVVYRFADFTSLILTLVFLDGGALILAFVKINGQTFHYFILNVIQTMRKPKLRLWNKALSNEDLNYLRNEKPAEILEKMEKKAVGAGHIRNLSLVVNTGGFYRSEDDNF
mgnify:CR=1 FL=1